MPRVAKNPGSKPGRRTKEEELREFLETTGGDMSKLADYLGGALEPQEVPSAKDIRDRLLASVSDKIGRLEGIALIHALKTVQVLAAIEEAEQQAKAGETEDTRRPLLDRIDALPPAHASQLVKQEIERLDVYRQDLFDALRKLEAA